MAKLLTCKELAWGMNRSVTYVYAMRKAGFEMAGDRATLPQAIDWLSDHPNFRRNKVWNKSKTA